ncbi:MAG: AAA family ATPase [Thermoleophilia bacterium]
MAQHELIGRDDEVARLEGALEEGARGPVAVLLEGEPGIGKTSLWRATLTTAATRGARVLRASPAGTEADLSYGTVADLMGDALPEVEGDLPAPQRRALRVALLEEDAGGVGVDDRAVGAALLGSLRLLARRCAVVVGIDDLQWLDGASGAALAFAARRVDDAPITFLLAARPRWAASSLDPVRTFQAIGLRRLPVGALSLGAIHKLLHARLGMALPRPTLRRLFDVSGGNPFFALEIGRALQRRDHPEPGEPLPIPDTLDAIIRDRLNGLPEVTRRVLTVAALAAEPSVRLVGAGVALDDAVRADLLEADGERLRFTHPLLRTAAADLLGTAGRREVHRRLALLVLDADERARHLALGAEGPSAEIAAELDDAAARSAARGATDAAAGFARLALQLTPGTDRGTVLRRRVAVAERDAASGDVVAARETLEAILAELPPGPERAQALLMLSALCEHDMAAATELGVRALSEAPPDDDALRAAIGCQLALARFIGGRLDAAAAVGREALEHAHRSGDPAALAHATATVGLVDASAGRPRPHDFWEPALRAEADLPPSAFDVMEPPSLVYGMQLMWADRPDEARELLARDEARALAHGHEIRAYSAWFHLVELEVRAGRWDVAQELASRMEAFVGQRGLEQSQGAAHFCTAWVAAHRGEETQARTAALAGIANAERVGDTVFLAQCRCVLGFLELSLGDAAAADGHLRGLWPELRAMGYREPSIYPVLPNAAEALIQLGRLDEAAALLDELRDLGTGIGSAWATALSTRGLGLLEGARGDVDAAAARLEDALAHHARLPVPFERARTLQALGAVQRRRKQKRAGREALEEALATFERLGARIWAERTRGELARVSGRRASAVLTATEQRVADLVADGHSNREVADALFVSVRAVEANLTRIYAKLGIRGRAELMRAVLEGRRQL